jgi:hypothetical protein
MEWRGITKNGKNGFRWRKEDVITRKSSQCASPKNPKRRSRRLLGYGIQGAAQSLNMRDNGVKVIIGQEKEGIFKKNGTKQSQTDGFQAKTSSPWKKQPKKEPSKCSC